MGSSMAGILAISYMNQLECRVLSICPSCIFFTRYIDVILMLTSSSKEANVIYEKFQNIDRHIQFKIEHPDNTKTTYTLYHLFPETTTLPKKYTGIFTRKIYN